MSFQSLHLSLRSVYLNDLLDELPEPVHAQHLQEIEGFFFLWEIRVTDSVLNIAIKSKITYVYRQTLIHKHNIQYVSLCCSLIMYML